MEAVRWIWMKGWRWKSVAMGTERGRISQKSILLPVRVRMDTAVTLSATPQRTPPPAALPHHSCEFCMWACILCVSIVHLPLTALSLSSMCSEDQEALQAQKIWKKAIMLVWRAAANHRWASHSYLPQLMFYDEHWPVDGNVLSFIVLCFRYASVFLQPVSDDIAPGYHSIVHRYQDETLFIFWVCWALIFVMQKTWI